VACGSITGQPTAESDTNAIPRPDKFCSLLQRSVSCYQNVKSGAFRGIEKLTVFQTGPSD